MLTPVLGLLILTGCENKTINPCESDVVYGAVATQFVETTLRSEHWALWPSC